MAQSFQTHWNMVDLPQPPQTTVVLKHKSDTNISHFQEELNILLKLMRQIDLPSACALCSRLIYKLKLKFRSTKWLKILEKINGTALKILKSKFQQALIKIKKISSVKNKEMPSRALLEWLLLKMQGHCRVLLRLVITSYQCGLVCRQHLSIGHNWQIISVVMTLVSQLWAKSQLFMKQILNSYGVIYKAMRGTCYDQKAWSSQTLPEKLNTWIKEELNALGLETDVLKIDLPLFKFNTSVAQQQDLDENDDVGEAVSRNEVENIFVETKSIVCNENERNKEVNTDKNTGDNRRSSLSTKRTSVEIKLNENTEHKTKKKKEKDVVKILKKNKIIEGNENKKHKLIKRVNAKVENKHEENNVNAKSVILKNRMIFVNKQRKFEKNNGFLDSKHGMERESKIKKKSKKEDKMIGKNVTKKNGEIVKENKEKKKIKINGIVPIEKIKTSVADEVLKEPNKKKCSFMLMGSHSHISFDRIGKGVEQNNDCDRKIKEIEENPKTLIRELGKNVRNEKRKIPNTKEVLLTKILKRSLKHEKKQTLMGTESKSYVSINKIRSAMEENNSFRRGKETLTSAGIDEKRMSVEEGYKVQEKMGGKKKNKRKKMKSNMMPTKLLKSNSEELNKEKQPPTESPKSEISLKKFAERINQKMNCDRKSNQNTMNSETNIKKLDRLCTNKIGVGRLKRKQMGNAIDDFDRVGKRKKYNLEDVGKSKRNKQKNKKKFDNVFSVEIVADCK